MTDASSSAPVRAPLGSRIVPCLLASDMRATLRFYTETLGFRLTGRHPGGSLSPEWMELTRDGVALQFFADAPAGLPREPALSGTLFFDPADVLRLAGEWRGRVDFAWGPEVMPYGMRELGIQDPDGYHLAFTEPA